ncbi:MAG: hypothetical protein ABI693_23080 [Bryobacteraceae bacterium]
MSKWLGAALLAALILLFLIANRGAYGGYFQDDDLDNLGWTTRVHPGTFLVGLLTPQLAADNFRPTGHLAYRLLGNAAGLDFRPYIAFIHVVHLFNVWLLWLLARRLKATPVAATAAALFFAFHMGVFDAYWRPMYLFDILCACFCLLALIAYTHNKIILSLLAFWLAYKSKEIAVMLPAVLALYEYWLGSRRWKPLIPFFAISASFGLQALFLNHGRQGDYALHFSLDAFRTCLHFYADHILLAPWAGFALLPLALLIRNRRLWFGVASAFLFMVPLLFLPGRLFAVYLYVPLFALALGLSALAESVRPVYVALFFALWIPINYRVMIEDRKATLATAHENRAYVTQAAAFFASQPKITTVVFDGAPPSLHRWGVEAAIRRIANNPNIEIRDMQDREAQQALHKDGLAVLSWSQPFQRLFTITRLTGAPIESYIRMGLDTPIWQLDDGWYTLESDYRWIGPRATARLHRPAGVKHFDLTVNVSPLQITQSGAPNVQVSLDGHILGSHLFTKTGWDTVRWPIPEGISLDPVVELTVTPTYRPSNGDPRTLGAAIAALGFRP